MCIKNYWSKFLPNTRIKSHSQDEGNFLKATQIQALDTRNKKNERTIVTTFEKRITNCISPTRHLIDFQYINF